MGEKPKLKLSSDQLAEIRFCQEYATRFRHRTPGANRMLLVATLADALGLVPLGDVVVTRNSPITLEHIDDPFKNKK